MTRDAGWYRDELGYLRYWNGRSWAGEIEIRWPPLTPPRPVTPVPRWRVPAIALGWVAAIFTLGMLLIGVSADGVDCGTVFGPRDSGASCAAALHSRTTAAAVTGAGALLCFAGSSRTAGRLTRSRSLRGAPALA